MALDAGGDVYVAGRINVAGRLDEIAVMKLANVDGEILWTSLQGGADRLDDRALDVAVGPDGNPVVTGLVQNQDGTATLLTVKLDASDGGNLWERATDGLVNDQSGDGRIAVDAAGDVIVAAKAWHAATGYDVLCVKLAGADGGELWRTDWTRGTASDDPSDMLLDGAGDPIVVGATDGDYLAVKLSGVDGSESWVATYAGPQGWYDVANCVTLGAGGEVLVSGFSDGTGTSWDVATLALDPATGATDWSVRWDGDDHLADEAEAVVFGPDGSLFVSGYSYDGVTGMDRLVLAYDPATDTAVDEAPARAVALTAWPNPFNPRTTVGFRLAARSPVRLTVHDLAGRLVAVLAEGVLGAGDHAVSWDGRDQGGGAASAGVYVARLRVGGTTAAFKLTLAR